MKKSIFLHVHGDDYAASIFEENLLAKDFYEKMEKENVKSTVIEDDFYAEVDILEFEQVSDDFVEFVVNRMIDSKHETLIKIK